jgi:hypothetical protein
MSDGPPVDLAAAVSLGRPQDWPAEMRTIVATTLTCRVPPLLWLGPQDLFIASDDASAAGAGSP